jgi:hypothetical protein
MSVRLLREERVVWGQNVKMGEIAGAVVSLEVVFSAPVVRVYAKEVRKFLANRQI